MFCRICWLDAEILADERGTDQCAEYVELLVTRECELDEEDDA